MTDHKPYLAENGSRLFKSIPDDGELADKLNVLFGEGGITAKEVGRARKRFYNRPTRGEKTDKKQASPTKHVIRNKAIQLNLLEAIAEILDNIFDNYERASDAERVEELQINITAYPDEGDIPAELVITENSGGIRSDHIMPLIQLGLSKRATGGIGAWGEGFKIAAFSLGSEVEVFSKYPGEDAFCVHFPHGWLEEGSYSWKSWDVETSTVSSNEPDEGATIIRINRLRDNTIQALGMSQGSPKSAAEACKELAEYYAEIYAEKWHRFKKEGYEISIRIDIDEEVQYVVFKEDVRTRLIQNMAFIPWLRPIHWEITWEVEVEDPVQSSGTRKATLKINLYAGLFAQFNYSSLYRTRIPGVEMWGNGRLFSLKGKIDDESVGWGYKFGGNIGTNPKANASSRRIGVIALFSSDDSRDIPWAAPVKNDYNRRSEFYAEIQQACASAISLFKSAAALLESSLEPFSRSWVNLSDKEKLDILFKDSDADDQFRNDFAGSRFGRKVLDHQPEFTFRKISGKDANVTVSKVYDVKAPLIKDTVKAASDTKNSAGGIVEYLQAIFPLLHRAAELEEKLGLGPNEEIQL